MCIPGCDCNKRPPSPSSSDAGSCPNSTTTSCPPTCRKAEIKKPRGSLDASTNPTDSWWSTPCYHFDFQGVVSGLPGPYALEIEGEVNPSPPYTCKWTLDAAAGTLTNDTTPTPTHTPPAAPGEGTLRLTGMNGGTEASCKDEKKVKIYEVHLARDFDNFGVGRSCSGPWTFTKYGATIKMPNTWNCHGSTRHLYDGSGTGSAGPSEVSFLLNPARLKKIVTVTHTETGGGSHPPLGPLERGDIVAYYTASGQLAHTQTCTGNGNETYGANNVPVRFPGLPGVDEAWQWATSPAGDWANNIKKDLFPGATPFTIKVFSKP